MTKEYDPVDVKDVDQAVARGTTMKNRTHASQKVDALVGLLQRPGGLDLRAEILHNTSADAEKPELVVELSGSDAGLLTARNGELLHAIEHVAAKMLGLEPEEHHRISFDALRFKTRRNAELKRLANAAVVRVRTTASAYVFPPMMSRERRLLHLELASSGLKTASTGEHFQRSVILYPAGVVPPAE